MTAASKKIKPVSPDAVRLEGVRVLPRVFHQDPRGFLVETLRRDDTPVDGAQFAMSYASLTYPGQFRDHDRWHLHRVQTDRFAVALGEMILALYDGRPASPTRGRLEVVRHVGAPFDRPDPPPGTDFRSHLVSIPPGVYHCIGNLSSRPFLLINFPTELYDARDELRTPFDQIAIDQIDGPFAWERVSVDG